MTETRDDRSHEAILALVGEVEREAPGGAETLFMGAMLADAPLPYDFALSCPWKAPRTIRPWSIRPQPFSRPRPSWIRW